MLCFKGLKDFLCPSSMKMAPLVFHSVCWSCEDYQGESLCEDDKLPDPQCYIHCFGKTEKAESVHLQIKFYPFCFMEIRKNWDNTEVNTFLNHELPWYVRKDLEMKSLLFRVIYWKN